MAEQKHLNSLGFAIGGKQSRPGIAWGYDTENNPVRIDVAQRGGSQSLRCECHALLIAKKGDIREHHFAHKAGNVRHCEQAATAAFVKFIADTLLDSQEVALPFTAGRVGYAEVLAISTETVDGQTVHIVDAQRGRRLLIFARVRRVDLTDLRRWCLEKEISGMVIDLTAFRNRADEEIRLGVRSAAPREWLKRRTDRDLEASLAFRRRLYGLS